MKRNRALFVGLLLLALVMFTACVPSTEGEDLTSLSAAALLLS